MYTTIWGILQECGDFTWRVSDCEELVGVTTGGDCVFCKCFNLLVPSLPYKAPR